MATYYEQSLSGNIKSLNVCGLGINSWLVNGPCIAGAYHPVKVRKLQSESRVSTGAVTMYGQIRRASAGTGCVTSLELMGGPRPQACTRPQATSAQGTSNKLTSHKPQAWGGSRPQARGSRSLHKVLQPSDRGPLAALLP